MPELVYLRQELPNGYHSELVTCLSGSPNIVIVLCSGERLFTLTMAPPARSIIWWQKPVIDTKEKLEEGGLIVMYWEE